MTIPLSLLETDEWSCDTNHVTKELSVNSSWRLWEFFFFLDEEPMQEGEGGTLKGAEQEDGRNLGHGGITEWLIHTVSETSYLCLSCVLR